MITWRSNMGWYEEYRHLKLESKAICKFHLPLPQEFARNMEGKEMMRTPRALLIATACLLAILLTYGSAYACTTIIVGKDASAGGCVLVAHNEDDGPPQVVLASKIAARTHEQDARILLSGGATLEQVPETAGFLWLDLPGQPFSQCGLNEWGVCITSDRCPSREDREDLTDGGIGPMLRRVIIERARTARDGARLAGELIERLGYQASGRTYFICDPEEAWLLCVVQGRHWLAWRVPDDEVCVVANSYVVRDVDLTNQDQVMASEDIVDYATLRGWYDPERDGKFDFARAYADPDRASNSANFGRQWSALRRFAQGPLKFGMDLPASVKPIKAKRKVTVADLMAALRDHYEESDHYHPDPETGDPHVGDPRTVCCPTTQAAFVAQLRRGEPNDVQLVWWVCLSLPCTSCFVPFHYGIPDFPAGWQSGGPDQPSEETWQSWTDAPFEANAENAFATAINCQARVREDYSGRIGALRERFAAIEADALERQSSFEKKVLKVWASDQEAAALMLLEFSKGIYDASLEAMADVLAAD